MKIGAKNLNKTASHVKMMYQGKLVKNLIHFVDNTYTCMIRPTSISWWKKQLRRTRMLHPENQSRTPLPSSVGIVVLWNFGGRMTV